MSKAKRNYVYGTSAEKIDYDVYKENRVLKEKRKRRSNNKVKFKIIFNIFLAFSLGIIIILRYAMITEMSYNINMKTKELNNIVNENSRLRVEIENNMNLAKVKEIAENKLGMQKPDKYQIVYLNIPKGDFSVVSERYKEASAEDKINSLLDKVKNLAQLLY